MSTTQETVRTCRVCGCTDARACQTLDGQRCHWVDVDLCSACDPAELPPPYVVVPNNAPDALAHALLELADSGYHVITATATAVICEADWFSSQRHVEQEVQLATALARLPRIVVPRG